MKKIEIHFVNWFYNEKESKFSFAFQLNVKMKFALKIRIFSKKSLALIGQHIAATFPK